MALASGSGRPSDVRTSSSVRPFTRPKRGNARPQGHGSSDGTLTRSSVRYRRRGKAKLWSGVPTTRRSSGAPSTGWSSRIP